MRLHIVRLSAVDFAHLDAVTVAPPAYVTVLAPESAPWADDRETAVRGSTESEQELFLLHAIDWYTSHTDTQCAHNRAE